MNLERLLRDVDGRLQAHDPEVREAVLDVLREAIARERRRADPSLTVETERERRLEAEEMREMVEAIDRPASTEEALAEAVKQIRAGRRRRRDRVDLGRIGGPVTACWRRSATRRSHSSARRSRSRASRRCWTGRGPTAVADAEAEPRAAAPSPSALRSWAGAADAAQGEPLGLLLLGRRAASGFTEDGLRSASRIRVRRGRHARAAAGARPVAPLRA